MAKLTYEFVKSKFEELGYELLETKYKGYKSKMRYICSKHKGEGVQTISYRDIKRGRGCKYCGIERRASKKRLSIDDVRKLFKQTNKTLLSTSYKNRNAPLQYICDLHPDKGVQQTSYAVLKRRMGGCRWCMIENNPQNQKMDFSIIQDEFDKAGYKLLTQEKDYNNNGSPLLYRCGKHPTIIQKTTWAMFKQGRRCPLCNESSGERAVARFLDDHGITYEPQKTFDDMVWKGKLHIDFYIPNGIAIEYNGQQHYEPITFGRMTDDRALEVFHNIQSRDKAKAEYCQRHDIKLIVISYKDKDSIAKILAKELDIC